MLTLASTADDLPGILNELHGNFQGAAHLSDEILSKVVLIAIHYKRGYNFASVISYRRKAAEGLIYSPNKLPYRPV